MCFVERQNFLKVSMINPRMYSDQDSLSKCTDSVAENSPNVPVCMLGCSVVSNSVTPWTAFCQAPLSMWILQKRTLEWVAMPSSQGFLNPGTKPRSSALQENSLPSKPPGKPKNTGVSNLSLLQEIFPTQESNQGLLNCRRILFHLDYQRSPMYQCGYVQISKQIKHALISERRNQNKSGQDIAFSHLWLRVLWIPRKKRFENTIYVNKENKTYIIKIILNNSVKL